MNTLYDEPSAETPPCTTQHADACPASTSDDAQPAASERIERLLSEMGSKRPILLRILALCTEPRPEQDVVEEIAKMQGAYSVYAPGTLIAFLEKAGALEQVGANGDPLEVEEPVLEEGDAGEADCLTVAQPAVAYLRTTDAGRTFVEADDPARRTNVLFSDEIDLLPVYKAIMQACAGERGASTRELGAAFDAHHALKERRFSVARFTNRLEQAGAMVWDGAWRLTAAGEEALDELADIEAIEPLTDGADQA